jgi:hypothetical protein
MLDGRPHFSLVCGVSAGRRFHIGLVRDLPERVLERPYPGGSCQMRCRAAFTTSRIDFTWCGAPRIRTAQPYRSGATRLRRVRQSLVSLTMRSVRARLCQRQNFRLPFTMYRRPPTPELGPAPGLGPTRGLRAPVRCPCADAPALSARAPALSGGDPAQLAGGPGWLDGTFFAGCAAGQSGVNPIAESLSPSHGRVFSSYSPYPL